MQAQPKGDMANNSMKRMVVLAFLLFSSGTMLFAADQVTLTGKVTEATGKPLAHATVLVYHAGVKNGYSTFCPSCYIDCGKRALTNASGAFEVHNLSRDLWFELLVVHDGYSPEFVKKVDPVERPTSTVVLKVRQPVNEATRVVRGHVEGPHGDPMRDAVVTPFAILAGSVSIYGTPEGLDPIAVTNEEGQFELSYSKAVSKMALMIEARGMAPKFAVLPTGAERHTITVSNGALLRGRVVKNGKPVGGIEIGLNPRQPWEGGPGLTITGSVYDEIRIGTREDGSFAIPNVPAPEDWEIYGKMESIAPRGAINPVAVTTNHDDQEVNVGDIQIERGYRLQGKVVLSDRKQIADGMRIFISSDTARDVQSALLSTDGTFGFLGLAAGNYTLWASVKGYKVPKANGGLHVSINRDVRSFHVLLRPVSMDLIQH